MELHVDVEKIVFLRFIYFVSNRISVKDMLKNPLTLFRINPCAAGHGLHGNVQPGDSRHLKLQQRRQPGPQLPVFDPLINYVCPISLVRFI